MMGIQLNCIYWAGLTNEEVGGKWSHHETCEGLLLLVADIAQPCQVVCIHQPHDEYYNGFGSWDGPRSNMEVGAVHFNGLVAPL